MVTDPLPYARHTIAADDVDAVGGVLRSARLTQGPAVGRFEAELAALTGSGHAVAVANGTAALQVALRALGVGPGDEVIVPTLTFVATANAVVLAGAEPRFADVELATLNLAPSEVARLLSPRTKGVVAVHYAGHPAEPPGLPNGVFLLEDACHALGASWRGRPAGSLGDAACFSFHPAKAITTGEGGAITTSSDALARRCRRFAEHGLERDGVRFRGLGLPQELAAEESGPWVSELHDVSTNARLSDVAAALGESQLGKLDAFLERRRKLVGLYRDGLADVTGVALPVEREGARSAWHLFPIRLELEGLRGGRRAVFQALHERGIGCQVHYVPVHLQPWYRERYGTAWGDCPNAERAYLQLLSLPLFPAMSEADVARVVDALRAALAGQRR